MEVGWIDGEDAFQLLAPDRIRAFWSQVPPNEAQHISRAHPDSPQEDVRNNRPCVRAPDPLPVVFGVDDHKTISDNFSFSFRYKTRLWRIAAVVGEKNAKKPAVSKMRFR